MRIDVSREPLRTLGPRRTSSRNSRAKSKGSGRSITGVCCGPGEFGADSLGVGMADAVEDVQGVPPGLAGGLRAACTVVGVAEVSQDDGLPVEFSGRGEEAQSLLVAPDGLLVLTEPVMDVAEAVPNVCLVELIVQPALQGQRPLAVHQSLTVVSE